MSGCQAIIFFSLALLFAFTANPGHGLCAPICAGISSGDKVRDPTDCTRYYICLDLGGGEVLPSEEPMDCPSGEYFNDALSSPTCDPISQAPAGFCSRLCDPCQPHCSSPGEVTPHPTDCSTYFVCLEGESLLEVGCEASLPFYDYETGQCSDDPSLCYSYCDPCQPHCTEQGQRLPDPQDCRGFYLCDPPDIVSFTCPHEQVFNRYTGECEEDAPCITDCPDTTEEPSWV